MKLMFKSNLFLVAHLINTLPPLEGLQKLVACSHLSLVCVGQWEPGYSLQFHRGVNLTSLQGKSGKFRKRVSASKRHL